MRAQSGHMYRLADPKSYDNDEGVGYEYAAIPHDAGDVSGYYVFDAWIVDKDGNPHPGYKSNPIPIRSEDLDLSVAMPAPELPEPVEFSLNMW